MRNFYAVVMCIAVLMIASVSTLAQFVTEKDSAHCDNLLEKENVLETEHLSSADRSDLELCRMSNTLDGISTRIGLHDRHFAFWHDFRDQSLPLWFNVLDAFCEFHPSAQYIDLWNHLEHCPSNVSVIHTERAKLDTLFEQSMVLSVNFGTFVLAQNSEGRK